MARGTKGTATKPHLLIVICGVGGFIGCYLGGGPVAIRLYATSKRSSGRPIKLKLMRGAEAL
jgi:hypothetical protein